MSTDLMRTEQWSLIPELLKRLGVDDIEGSKNCPLAPLAERIVTLPVAPTTRRWVSHSRDRLAWLREPKSNQNIVIGIFMFGKVTRVPDQAPPDARSRVRALFDLFYLGYLQGNTDVHIIFSGHNGEDKAMEREFRNQLAHYSLALDSSNVHIYLEPKAASTPENVKKSCEVLHRHGIKPDILIFCSTDWHIGRMCLNYELARSISEFLIAETAFPNARIALLLAPYAHREPTQHRWRRWSAAVHVETHLIGPLVSVLFGIAHKQVDCLNQNVWNIAKEAFENIKTLMNDPLAQAKENKAVLDAWHKVQVELEYALDGLKQFIGQRIKKPQARTLPGPNGITLNWEQFAEYLNGLVNDVRFPSDPDRR